jgi:hypothetical protein
LAPYCCVCWAEWHFNDHLHNPKKRYGRTIPRPLDPGELQRRGKLLDSRPVYPEIFARSVLLRGRTLTNDLRPQTDYETGREKLETMGGYIAAHLGHARAGKGHAPNTDSDSVRMAWMAAHEGAPLGHGDEDAKVTPWSATMPRVDGGISDANWQPTIFPVGAPRVVATNLLCWFGLTGSEFFANELRGPMHRAQLAYSISWWRNRRQVDWVPNAKYLLSDHRMPEHYHRPSFRTFYPCRDYPNGYIPFTKKHEPDPNFQHHTPLCPMERANRSAYPNLDSWHSPIEWIQRAGVWSCQPAEEPTAKRLANCERRAEYKRAGSKSALVVYRHSIHAIAPCQGYQHPINYTTVLCKSIHRTKRWGEDWRTDRAMRDLEAKLDMYHYRKDATEERRVDVKSMSASAWKNLRDEIKKGPRWATAIGPLPYTIEGGHRDHRDAQHPKVEWVPLRIGPRPEALPKARVIPAVYKHVGNT